MLYIVFYELCPTMSEEIGQPCSIACAIRKVNYLTGVYNAQTEVVETICAMYEMWCYTQEEIGRKVLGEEMEKSRHVTISVIKKLLEWHLDEEIRQGIEVFRRTQNLQLTDSTVQTERGKKWWATKVLLWEDASRMNQIEPLSSVVIQELVEQHASLTAPWVSEKISAIVLRERLVTRLYDTYQIEKTPRALQGVVFRYKKKLEKWSVRNEIPEAIRTYMYTLWTETFPHTGNPRTKGQWYTDCAQAINEKYALKAPYLVSHNNVKNAIWRMNQKKKIDLSTSTHS